MSSHTIVLFTSSSYSTTHTSLLNTHPQITHRAASQPYLSLDINIQKRLSSQLFDQCVLSIQTLFPNTAFVDASPACSTDARPTIFPLNQFIYKFLVSSRSQFHVIQLALYYLHRFVAKMNLSQIVAVHQPDDCIVHPHTHVSDSSSLWIKSAHNSLHRNLAQQDIFTKHSHPVRLRHVHHNLQLNVIPQVSTPSLESSIDTPSSDSPSDGYSCVSTAQSSSPVDFDREDRCRMTTSNASTTSLMDQTGQQQGNNNDTAIPIQAHIDAEHTPHHQLLQLIHMAPHEFAVSQCGRRMFLGCLILATKYLQEPCPSNKAWSKLSMLPLNELAMVERIILKVMDYEMNVHPEEYARFASLLYVAQST